MNYKEIIFDGYLTPSSSKNLEGYFKRQFLNAEKRHYSNVEFFDGCMDVIQHLEERIEASYYKRKNDLYLMLDMRKQGIITSSDNPKPLTDDDMIKIKDFEEEIRTISREQFPENLFTPYFEHKYKGDIYWSELQHIKNTINEAKLNGGPKEKPKSEIIEPLDFNLNQTDIVHFFDLLVDADIIKEPINEVHKSTKGGFYGKLSKYFTAKGRNINRNSAKQVKSNKDMKHTPYSGSYFAMLNDLKYTIERKLENPVKN